MPIEQGINKRVAIVKQSGLGVLGSSGSRYRRRVTAVFRAPVDTFENNEIASHQQGTGANFGPKRPVGQLSGLLSGLTYSDEFAALFRKTWAAVSSLTGLTVTIAGAGPFTVTRSAGDFLAGGIKAGMVVRLSGGTLDSGTTGKNLLVVSVTATVLTVVTLNGSTMVAQSSIASVTCTVPGKHVYAPTTGHTNDYFTIEETYLGLTRYELWGDMQVAQAALSFPPSGNATVNFDWVGRTRALSGTQTLTSPNAETTSAVLTSSQGVIVVNGAQVVNITSLDVTINGNTSNLDPTVGSNAVPDNQRGRIVISGTFSAYFDAVTLQTIFENRTATALHMALADSALAGADFVALSIPRIKITSDDPDDGEKAVVRTYAFTAEIDSAGGASLATYQTIGMMQDSLVP